MRLSPAALPDLPLEVAKPAYDRAQAIGIVHFGIGAFHRAHQAWYTDASLAAGEKDWMIAGVSLRSEAVSRQLNPQAGLFTLTQRSATGEDTRVVGAVREVLQAGSEREAVVARIAAPSCHVVSFTITEKGYCRTADGSLDFAAAAEGFYPILADGLERRRAADLPGLTLVSCDNLSGNGKVLGKLMLDWLGSTPALADWFERECTTPDTMVDRIVPASTSADIAALEKRMGFRDEGAVFTEPFSQWVIEDSFAGERPRWDRVGAELVSDVAPYETAKLRMLNGAHSALAYLGLRRGHTFVHQAIADPELCVLVEHLMVEEAAASIEPAPEQDLAAYSKALVTRFQNPALDHRLIQIAMDGSQKIPQRWLETLAVHQRQERSCPSILTALAAWLCHLRGDNVAEWGPVDDPLAAQLGEIVTKNDLAGSLHAIFGKGGLMESGWVPSERDVGFVVSQVST